MKSASVIIPAHNEARCIGALLESIRQFGPPDAEVIVVDNGSTDGTGLIAEKAGARVVRLPEKVFPGVARNAGVGASDPSRPVLVFLDADMELTQEWGNEWTRSASSIRQDQLTGAIYEVSKHPSWIERRWFEPQSKRAVMDLAGGNLIMSRSFFSVLGGFDERLETGEDVDLCRRAQRLGNGVMLNRGFRAHHEGFPKTVAAFVRRERWHGKGDLATIGHALHSPVTLASAAFSALHMLLLLAIIDRAWPMATISILTIVALCALGVWRVLRGASLQARIAALPVMYLYYCGRSLSILDSIHRNAVRLEHRLIGRSASPLSGVGQ